MQKILWSNSYFKLLKFQCCNINRRDLRTEQWVITFKNIQYTQSITAVREVICKNCFLEVVKKYAKFSYILATVLLLKIYYNSKVRFISFISFLFVLLLKISYSETLHLQQSLPLTYYPNLLYFSTGFILLL